MALEDDNNIDPTPEEKWKGGLAAIMEKLAALPTIDTPPETAPIEQPPAPQANDPLTLAVEWINGKITQEPQPQVEVYGDDKNVHVHVTEEEINQILLGDIQNTLAAVGVNLLPGAHLEATTEQPPLQATPTIPDKPALCSCLGCRDRRRKAHRNAQMEEQKRQREERMLAQESTPTCKFYAPPGSVEGGNLPKDYPFNRAVPTTGLCGNKAIVGELGWQSFTACGFTEAQNACPGYEASPWEAVQLSEVSDPNGKSHVLQIRRTRFGLSTRFVYEVVTVDGETENVLHRVDANDHGADAEVAIKELFKMELNNFEETGHSSQDKPVAVEVNPSYIATVTAV